MNQVPFTNGAFGSYSLGMSTGILPVIGTLGAGAEVFQFRFVSAAARKCAVRRIRLSASVTTTMFAAGVPLEIALFKSTAWTAAGTGGTTPTIAAMLKRRTDMEPTVIPVEDIRIATTAALGAGTKTLETIALSNIVVGGPITGNLNGTIIQPNTSLWEAYSADGDNPIELAHREGLSIVVVNAPATGVWRLSVNIDWTEFANQ